MSKAKTSREDATSAAGEESKGSGSSCSQGRTNQWSPLRCRDGREGALFLFGVSSFPGSVSSLSVPLERSTEEGVEGWGGEFGGGLRLKVTERWR